MSKKNNTNKLNRIITKKRVVITLLVSMLLVGGYIFFFTKGYPQYYFAYIKCEMKQPIAVSYYFGSQKIDYSRPGDENYPGPNMFVKYVCTDKEAQDLGARYLPSGELIN